MSNIFYIVKVKNQKIKNNQTRWKDLSLSLTVPLSQTLYLFRSNLTRQIDEKKKKSERDWMWG